MNNHQNNRLHGLSKNHFNKNYPKTPCRKNSLLKESNQKLSPKFFDNLIQKEQKSIINTKKNSNLYSSSILNKKNNLESKNKEIKCKDIKSFSNSGEFKSFFKDKKIHLSNKNNKKKTDYFFYFENYKTKKNNNKINYEINLEAKGSQNKINKTQSFINNSNKSYNNYNYISHTVKNAINSSVQKTALKSKSRPSSLLLNKKLKEEKRKQNKGKPMSLLQTSKDKKEKTEKNNKDIIIKKNYHINTTHINYYSNCKISNSNYFLKNNIFFNKTCANDTYNNNLMNSEKEHNPVIINEKLFKNNKNNKNKEMKKSQSQSHIVYQKSQYTAKLENIFKFSNKKTNDDSSQKKSVKIKPTNFNLNINNINNFNNKYLFNCNNLNKSSSSVYTKSKIVNIKNKCGGNKKNNFCKDITNNNFNLINALSILPEENTKDKLFMNLINLWTKFGGINNSYIFNFIKYTKDNDDKNIIIQNEINELSLIINILNTLNENIKKRNEIIEKLKYISNNNENNIDEIKQLLIILSSISINVINEYNSFLKEISLDLFINKYNINRINNFDINYFFNMETDCYFLMNNPFLNKNFDFTKNIPFLSVIDNEITKNKIYFCKYILFKAKIYQDLLNEKEKSNLNFDNLFTSNNNITNRSETNMSINSINSNKFNKIIPKNKIIEKNIEFIITPKKENNTENNFNNKNINEEKNDIELYRNDLLYNNKNFNSFTFGKESKLPKIKKEDILYISPYNPKKDPKLILLYTSYLSYIEERMKLSFNINRDIYYYSKIGIYPKILLFKDLSSNVKAICSLSYNQSTNSDKKILTITNLSCMEGYKISTILLYLIEYCQNNEIYFDSIEISLYYIKKEGKFILDSEYENEIKNEAKFKWVRLENDGENRKIVYHYVNNNIIINKENIISDDNNYMANINQTKIGINIINYSLINYYQKYGFENIFLSEHSQLYPIINLLKKYYLIDNDETDISQIMDNFKGIKLKKIIRLLSEYCQILTTNSKDFKNDYSNDDKFNIEFLYQFLESIEKNRNKNADLLCLNFFKIFINFNNIIKTEIDEFEYNIISSNDCLIEVFNVNNNNFDDDINNNYSNFNIYNNNENNNIKKYDDDVLYFIKSEKQNISFIFYEIKEDKQNINKEEINSLFNKILKKILIKDNEEPIKSYKNICVPSFLYKKRNIEKENLEEKLDRKIKLIEYELLYYSDEIEFCLENLPNNEIKFSFPFSKKLEDNEDVKIIKNNFIIAVINAELILDYHIPAMNIYYIDKENWVRINN